VSQYCIIIRTPLHWLWWQIRIPLLNDPRRSSISKQTTTELFLVSITANALSQSSIFF